jgi:hypothetical protein
MRKYFESLYSNELENLEIFDKFIHYLPKLNQGYIIHNVNISVMSIKIETTVKKTQD